ncbi:MAG TPA: hypothetical protein VFE47_18345 [Tepidisphaeraceae bacterium]|jgi:hypothetical protein|nr:hypothetical protein [Tepidisphaeraceae bacterium]
MIDRINLSFLIDRLVPDPGQCRQGAAAQRKAHPDASPLQLAARMVHSAKLRAAAAGAATGAASSPFTMIPAALADMAAVLRIEGALVGEIGALLDPDSLDDPHALKTDVISVIFPAAASQALRQVGIRAGERLSHAAMRKYATEDLVRNLSRFATRYLGRQLTREAVVAKAIPLVGMGIGAGWNWLEVKAIGRRAIHYYSKAPIGPALLPNLSPPASPE